MSALTAVAPRPSSHRGPTLARVVSAEWSKVTGLRSTTAIALSTIVVSGGLTYLAANASSTDPGFDPMGSLTTGLPLAQVGMLVLGVLVGTGEFSTGTFRSTFTAVPRRLPVLVAQAVVTAVLALLVALLAVGAAVLGLLPAAGSRDLALDLTGDGTPQVLAGMVGLLVGMALVGLAVGALLRRPVAAVTTAVGLVLVLPVALLLAGQGTDPMAPAVPGEVDPAGTVVTFLPGGAGMLLVPEGGMDGTPDLGVAGGALVLACWVLVPLAVAGFRLRTRDLT